LLSFAGLTDNAYPLALQIGHSISFYPPSLERRLDISQVRTHMLRAFNNMLEQAVNFPLGLNHHRDPEVQFLFGGYSWRRQDFRLWRLRYSKQDGQLMHASVRGLRGEPRAVFAFMGDRDAVSDGSERLFRLMSTRGKTWADGFNMEPLEVLRDVIGSAEHPAVGGPVQVAKVYRFMQTQFFAVEQAGAMTVAGRPLLSYEKAFLPVIDVDNPISDRVVDG
jgi:hypothetical protein